MSTRIDSAVMGLLIGLSGGFLGAVALMGHHTEVKTLKTEVRAEQQARGVEASGEQITARVGAKAEGQAVQIRTVTKEVVRYVPQILTPDVDREFPLPVGFVRLHDAAAVGNPASLGIPSGEPDDSASDVKASEAAVVIAENYGTCTETAAQLTNLQQWVAEQVALHNGDGK